MLDNVALATRFLVSLTGNPFAEALKITDSITGPELGLGTATDAGFLVLNTMKNDPAKSKPVPFRFYIMVRVLLG